ncbi:hypothetical protein Ddye_014675 [Dipteronia dyeriana]|uniref:Reverse transcriptase n=1 Tax=Dipteronia dyeriana TaxID=168575 RepID=A0AAE0CKT9_9ROSI|nr:hypothetical protein Ddye_014675 [Dipteronia dyeriana]
MPRSISDHCAISLGEPKVVWGPRPFRFDNVWLEDKVLMAEVRKGWGDSNPTGSSSRILQAKLLVSKNKIKARALSKVKDWVSTKALEYRLLKIDDKAASSGWSDSLRQERLKALIELWKALRREEQQWRQKPRVKWLVEGDRNSKIFHCVASGRRRKNFIENISFDGVRKSKPVEVREGVVDFFEKHFKNVAWSRPKILELPLKKLSDAE